MQSFTKLQESSTTKRLIEISQNKWENLDEKKKVVAKQLWKMISYKWQWQIAFNASFMAIWALDRKVPAIHEFDIRLLGLVPIPHWLSSWIHLV